VVAKLGWTAVIDNITGFSGVVKPLTPPTYARSGTL